MAPAKNISQNEVLPCIEEIRNLPLARRHKIYYRLICMDHYLGRIVPIWMDDFPPEVNAVVIMSKIKARLTTEQQEYWEKRWRTIPTLLKMTGIPTPTLYRHIWGKVNDGLFEIKDTRSGHKHLALIRPTKKLIKYLLSL